MLIFEHLSKTAGTTFHGSYLPAAFPAAQRLVLRGSPDENAADLERAAALSGDASRQPAIIAGHFAGRLRGHFPSARFITLVREPVARAVSAYLHRVWDPAWNAAYGAFDPAVVKLVDFVESERLGEPYRNGQARVLLGPDFHELDDDAIRLRLAGRYATVGHTERFDEFVFSLHASEGLPLCLYNNRLVRRHRGGVEPGREECAAVRSYNAVDLRLHRIVSDDFEKWCRALPPDRSALLERYLRVLRQYREETHGDENQAIRLDERLTWWDQARFYYRLFGRLPTVRSDAATHETLALESLTVTTHAVFDVRGNSSAGFSTSALPWAYVATRRWPSGAEGLRLVVLVETGEMGLAVTDRDDGRRLLVQVSVGKTNAPIAVDLWPDRVPGELVFRNCAGGHFQAQLFSLQVLVGGADGHRMSGAAMASE
jgi:hypothetical protein